MRRMLSWILAALLAPIMAIVLFCGRGEAWGSDDLEAKLRSAVPGEHSPAMEALQRASDDDAVKALVKIVEERRDDWKLQISAMRLLGDIANPLATDILIKVVTDTFFNYDCPALKWNGIVALRKFRNDPRVVDALLYVIDEDSFYLREAVIETLGRIGNRKTLPYLISAFGDRSFAVRMSAVRALGEMNDIRAIPHLKEIADNDAEPLIRREALKVLEGLDTKTSAW